MHGFANPQIPQDHGSCHCGAVTMALKVKPLEIYDISNEKERIIECNCSICMRVSSSSCCPSRGLSNTATVVSQKKADI